MMEEKGPFYSGKSISILGKTTTLFPLTLSCLEIFLTKVVWTRVNFENNFSINHNFTKYLKENCELDFLKVPFGREMSPI